MVSSTAQPINILNLCAFNTFDYIGPRYGCTIMRVLLQRTAAAEVWIDGALFSSTKAGLLLLHGTHKDDQEDFCGILADKAVNLRIFEDKQGKMNLSALDIGAEIMIVSQFTLYADSRKGRRPGFSEAMEPQKAEKFYNRFVELVRASELKVATGEFGASMEVKLTNSGPVTILLEHEE